jgi:hypothetical protein
MRSVVNNKLLYASNAMSDLIMTGVLKRYPRLRFVLVENEVSWIPFYLTQYNKYWNREQNLDSPLTMLPSEYFFRQFYATFFNDAPAPLGVWFLGQQQADVVERLSSSQFDMARVVGSHHTGSGARVG